MVVSPAPLGPKRAKKSPFATVNETSFTATFAPYLFVTEPKSIIILLSGEKFPDFVKTALALLFHFCQFLEKFAFLA
jgi:hypothetical protein